MAFDRSRNITFQICKGIRCVMSEISGHPCPSHVTARAATEGIRVYLQAGGVVRIEVEPRNTTVISGKDTKVLRGVKKRRFD